VIWPIVLSLLGIGFYLGIIIILPEFRIAGVPSKIRTFQIVAHKLKRLTLFDF
jgi:hypothetical protein